MCGLSNNSLKFYRFKRIRGFRFTVAENQVDQEDNSGHNKNKHLIWLLIQNSMDSVEVTKYYIKNEEDINSYILCTN
jgi:hypothetical protein